VDLYIHFPLRFHGLVLNYLSTGRNLFWPKCSKRVTETSVRIVCVQAESKVSVNAGFLQIRAPKIITKYTKRFIGYLERAFITLCKLDFVIGQCEYKSKWQTKAERRLLILNSIDYTFKTLFTF
jgi:hypothetical protein